MSDRDEAAELLGLAGRELRGFEAMLDEGVFADETFGFHAQQIVEKCLKAWLCLLGEVYPYTHDLSDLVKALRARGAEPGDDTDFRDLNPFAVEFRYHALDEKPTAERRETIRRVREVYEQVNALLLATPPEV